MPVVLSRVDDRLIHGQVVIGWGRPLAATRIVLVDDEVAANEWEQDLYRMAVPEGIEVVFSRVADALGRLAQWHGDPHRTMLLTGTLPAMVALQAADPVAVGHVNLGGIHHQPGRTERLPYVYLSPEEYLLVRDMAGRGADVTAQDVPSAMPVGVGGLA